MQGATLLCVVAITLVLWAVLRQPGLGVTLAADAAANRVTIAAVDTLGPARGLAVPATLAAIGATPSRSASAPPRLTAEILCSARTGRSPSAARNS